MIQEYLKKIKAAELNIRYAQLPDQQLLAMEELENARNELNTFIRKCKLNGTKGAIRIDAVEKCYSGYIRSSIDIVI